MNLLELGVRTMPQELTFAALCMNHNKEALKTFKYDGNESTYSVHINDRRGS